MDNQARNAASLAELDRFCRAVLSSCGTSDATVDAVTRAMMHGTRHGIDSHGVRLLELYVAELEGGQVKKNPEVKVVGAFGAIETLDAGDGHGALATYTAMDHAIALARQFGIGAVAIRNNSHFGPAGAYSIEAARQGMIGLTFCNSDNFVRLHGGAQRFHGTNPIAVAVPSTGRNPWLLDMATSAIPFNRVLLYRSTGTELPHAVASDAAGVDTQDAEAVDMLAPLGGEFGFKGAGLAGLSEILSAVVTGMRLSFDLPSMMSADMTTPRGLGAFVIAINPQAFGDKATFETGMARYLNVLRNSPTREGQKVMAPGDREWAVAAHRERDGVMIDPATQNAFAALSKKYGVALPAG